MFDFFFKKKKVVLDCFTFREYVHTYAKIDHGSNFYPDWWKKSANDFDGYVTIKYCSALTNFYNKGIVIPSWFSLKLNVESLSEKRYSWNSSNDFFKNISHRNGQFDRFCLGDGFNFKIQSPWRFKTKRKVHFVWSDPIWSNRENLFNYSALPGVIEFRNQCGTNINLFLKYGDKPKSIYIEPLQPLVMLHAMSEEDIEIKNHLVSEKEWNNINGYREMLFLNDAIENYVNLLNYRKHRQKILDKLEKDNG